MNVAIRQADATDLAAMRSITERAYAVWIPVLGAPPLPVTDDHARRIARGEVLLACDDRGTAVGLIVVEPGDDHDLIFSVAVDPDYAGHGIGPTLMAEVERRARANGKSRVTLYTNVLMQRNIALYAKLGYRETGRRPNPARPTFTIVDMVKDL